MKTPSSFDLNDPKFISPILATSSGAALNGGFTLSFPSATSTIALRNGAAGGLIGLGLYSAMRFLYQERDDALSSSICLATLGGGVSSGYHMNIAYCLKGSQFAQPEPWLKVGKSGLSGSLVLLGLYGTYKCFFTLCQYSAHHVPYTPKGQQERKLSTEPEQPKESVEQKRSRFW